MNDKPVRHETVETELQRLLDDLAGADAATVAAETERLRKLAELVPAGPDREWALTRAAQLPRLLAGPPTPSSPEFAQAQLLFHHAISEQGSAQTRIPGLERTIEQIGELAGQAPARESFAIRRLLSPLGRLLDHLRATAE
jgi:hypothetical protein